MSSTISIIKDNRQMLLLDFIALAVIVFMPAISHLLPIPLYLLEPMRFLVLLSLLFANRPNAYFLAFLLPIAAFVGTSHPVFLKSILIAVELVVNIALFYALSSHIKSTFLVMLSSILLSKAFYYLLKYIAISAGGLSGTLISTTIYWQLAFSLLYSLFWVFVFNAKEKSKTS